MNTFRTLFRAVVMLATLGLLAKAWYHYGPTLGELQAISNRAVDVAAEAWSNHSQPSTSGSSLASAPPAPPASSLSPPAPFVSPAGQGEPTRLPTAPAQASVAGPVQPAAREVVVAPVDPAPLSSTAPPAATQPHDPLEAVIDRLRQLGVRDDRFTQWGSRGDLVRFTCDVPWAGSPTFTRQFEAVAVTPLSAAQQVLGEIEAWRASVRVSDAAGRRDAF